MVKRRPSTRFVTAHSSAHRWPRRTSVPSVFTAFVRSLQGEETPDADLFHDAWHALRDAMANEMKKRGLWQNPPCYLGVCGWERWDSEEPAADSIETARQVSALGELVADCYAFIFVARLQNLKQQLAKKPDINGLVLLNIRHFLLERQKVHDPLGFRVFELLQAAVADAISRGDLYVLGGDERIRNHTLLGFAPTAEPRPSPLDLEHIAVRWNDELLPSLITAHSRQYREVIEQLRRRLLELPRHGVEAFRFRDLLDPLKSDARRRWASLLGGEEIPGTRLRDAAQGPAPAPPESSFESRQSFEHLTSCVSASIESLEGDPRTRLQLSALWQFLRRHHGEDDEAEAGRGEPSYRQLGQRLNIPRERLPMLFNILRRLVACCRTGG